MAELILSYPEVNVNQQNGGQTLLHLAIEIENADIIKLLLEKTADIADQGPRLLRIVSARGHADLVRMLLEQGVDPTETDEFEWSAELHAIAAGQEEVIRLFKEQNGINEMRRSKMPLPSPPTGFSETDKSDQCKLENGSVVRFDDGDGKRNVSIRANNPIPPQAGIFYFEVEILECPEKGAVGIGVCTRNTAMSEFPGWSRGSWGYHADDGHKYHDTPVGEEYGDTARAGDVIGCQLNLRVGELSFSRDQRSFGVAFNQVHGCLFPVVAMNTPGTRTRVNFRDQAIDCS